MMALGAASWRRGGAAPPGPGNFPIWLGATITPDNVSISTSHQVDMPAVVSAGDLLVVIFASDSNTSVGIPSGWTLLDSQSGGSTRTRGTWAYKVAEGTEAGGAVTFTTSSNERSSAICIRVQVGTYSGAPEISVSLGEDKNPDPPLLSPSSGAGDYLWIASYCQESRQPTPPSYPFPDGNAVTSTGSNDTNMATCGCCYTEEVTSSMDPGVFTLYTDFMRNWVAATIAVRGA